MCADDDILLEQGLIDAYKFLVDSEDHVAFCGKSLAYSKSEKKIFNYRILKPIDLTNNDRIIRVKTFFKQVKQILWGVYKKEPLLKAFTYIADQKFENDNMIEIALASILLYDGKIYNSDSFLNIREMADDSWGRRTPIISYKSFNSDHNIRSSVKKFINSIDKATHPGFGSIVINAYFNQNKFKKINIIFKKLRFIINNLLKLKINLKPVKEEFSLNIILDEKSRIRVNEFFKENIL
jgi:hypothetical protein